MGSTLKPGQFWPHLQRGVKGSVTGVGKIMRGPERVGCCWLFSLPSTRTRGLPTELMDTTFMLNRRWHFTQYAVKMCYSMWAHSQEENSSKDVRFGGTFGLGAFWLDIRKGSLCALFLHTTLSICCCSRRKETGGPGLRELTV